MTDQNALSRAQHFRQHWLLWAALRHFLSAHLLRELAVIIVDEMSGGSLTLPALFEESPIEGLYCMEAWLIRPLDQTSALAEYLQDRIRGFAWQSDSQAPTRPETDISAKAIRPSTLENAIRIGSADFGYPRMALDQIQITDQSSITAYIEGMKISISSLDSTSPNAFLEGLSGTLDSMVAPLDIVVAKHFGDLCGDMDRWDKALVLYDEAHRRLSQDSVSEWRDFVEALRDIVVQSRATAQRTLYGPGHAAAILNEALTEASIGQNPLMLANASFDALVISEQAAKDASALAPDRRTALLLPPLLQRTHNVSSPLHSWLEGDTKGSHREFWAVLRRQIALGSSTETSTTKALYARSILDDLDKEAIRRSDPDFFRLAIRLLVESGNSRSAAQIPWNGSLVTMYVDQSCVDLVISRAECYPGALSDRQRVAIELFQKWLEAISRDHVGVAHSMLKYIAQVAVKSPTSLYERWNLGGQCLHVLNAIGNKRPELRQGLSADVSSAVNAKLRGAEFWTGRQGALEVALSFSDAFSSTDLEAVVDVTLSLLSAIDPSTEAWPIIGPALDLLVSRSVKQLSTKVPGIGQRVIDAVLRFGIHQPNGRAKLFYYLHDFDKPLLRDHLIKSTLQDAVTVVRDQSRRVNTSNVVENIQALLLAPVISGTDGVQDALDGLAEVLKTAQSPRPSIGLVFAYSPLLWLSYHQDQISNDLAMSIGSFQVKLREILTLLIDLWNVSKQQPLIFSTFSLPPATRPDSTIVHNWAFSSIRFAESLDQEEPLEQALSAAATNPWLADSIALARATRSAAGDSFTIDADAIRSENRETFYAAIGGRLVVLQRIDVSRSQELCRALLDQCFRHGPRAVDAAVFWATKQLDLMTYVADGDHSDYIKRLENDRDLRLTLFPLLDMLGVQK